MKHKEDIYKKPKRLLSEYVTVIIVACVTTIFISFEIYSFISSGNQITTLVDAERDNPKEMLDLNESAVTSKTLEVPDEKITESKKLEENTISIPSQILQDKNSTLTVDVNTTKELKDNPLEDILKSQNEVKNWELLNTYNSFTLEEKHKLLMHAIENNHADNLTKMLKSGFTLNSKFYEGDANKLIFKRKYQVVFVLIKNNLLDISKSNKYGYTLLHEAAAKGHQALIRLIILKGININAQAYDGASALHHPSRLGYSITVKTLLALGINPNLRASLKYPGLYWNESTPLHIASKQGQLKIVKQLILAGADMGLKDGDGLTALDLARNADHSDVADFLESQLPEEEMTPVDDENRTQTDGNNSLVSADPLDSQTSF